MKVRAAEVNDAEQIGVLCDQLGYPADVGDASARLERICKLSEHGLFVAEEDGVLLGWIHVHLAPSLLASARAEIAGLVVLAGKRGGGVGRELMRCAESWAACNGCSSVRLRSNLARKGAHAFYERLGYRLAKVQKAFSKELLSQGK